MDITFASAPSATRNAQGLSTAHQRNRVRDRRNAGAAWYQRLAAVCVAAAATFASGGALAQSAPKPDWSLADMPSQADRIFVVTGGTSGMGFEDAKALSAAGARVIIAARNPERGAEAIASIRADDPDAQVQFEAVDLGDLASVRALAARLQAALPRIDGLINNAAIMAPPERGTSPDGLESQFAINYAGHFALTAELLPLLRKSDAPRVVTLSSVAAGRGRIDFEDLQSERAYDPYAAYAQSKLACLMFAMELQRRSDANGWGIRSVAAHPGIAVTELVARGPGLDSPQGQQWAANRDNFQTAAQGAIPTLFAATAPDAVGGAYYGPTGPQEISGPLGLATVPAAAQYPAASARLWSLTEQLTGSRFPAGAR
ncbi:SDR family NAD(P)-dependent oxidoreductase [Luteimonas aestuarii]|uniref:SDR family NAD(P)-dependent oxidoreductase n=1 Tax=Luteimonas aestuarii TaxID=453837 RepID=A0A4R5TTG1_9GAMM|nr:SDR family oxidoreductase [Luteimonas aestuarii]TDK23768.1 SDR family NAD(P)-dependent oxidoreductase [Luteimonas aestuarii]